jgi:hypothetical protein
MAGTHEGFEELRRLLSNAKDRYRSVRAEVVHTVDAALAKEANRRFVDWRIDQGNPGMGILGKPGPPEREDFYHEYEGWRSASSSGTRGPTAGAKRSTVPKPG